MFPELETRELFGSLPGQRTHDEHLELPAFAAEVQACADDIRYGRISGVGDIGRIWQLCGQMQRTRYDNLFAGPDGALLSSYDAELVWSMRTFDAWVFADDEAGILRQVQGLFQGKQDELDPAVHVDDLEAVLQGRHILHRVLGLENAYSATLDNLSQIVGHRLVLHQAILDGQGQALNRLEDTAVVEAASQLHTESDPDKHDLPEDGPLAQEEQTGTHERYLRLVPSLESLDDNLDFDQRWDRITSGHQRVTDIRSHRKGKQDKLPNQSPRLRRVAAAAAVVLIGLFVPANGLQEAPAKNGRVVVEAPADFSPPETSAQDQGPPITETTAADSLRSLGEYGPGGAGTIWSAVDGYAAELGYTDLTLTQIHQLTQRTLDYMDSRLPGGMNWSKAKQIPSGLDLPFPPSSTMQSWLDQLTHTQV